MPVNKILSVLGGVAALVLCWSTSSLGTVEDRSKRPNVIIFLVDDVRIYLALVLE